MVHKTQRRFSGIAIDHAHEQNNKQVKGDGGAVGLTESSTQLLRWMASGPEIARAIAEFESAHVISENKSKDSDLRHHEEVYSAQKSFQNQVKALVEAIESMGNPFAEASSDMLVLDTKEIACGKVIETVKTIEKVGQEQLDSFVEERLVKRNKAVTDTIKRNNLPLFSNPRKSPTKEKQDIVSLKQNCSLFSQLYISCQVRQGNIDEFFSHENQVYPPSISKFGELRLGIKSDLLKCLEKLSVSRTTTPVVDALLIDGAALVNMLKPNGACKTFSDYSNIIYLPHIKKQM